MNRHFLLKLNDVDEYVIHIDKDEFLLSNSLREAMLFQWSQASHWQQIYGELTIVSLWEEVTNQ